MLTPLEKLEQLACSKGITIYNFHLSDTKKSACFRNDDIQAIVLDKPLISSLAEERELLAEEIGHYVTSALYSLEASYNAPIARSNRIKCEAKAKRWAVKKLLPAVLIQKALKNGAKSEYEIAEHCNVTVEFLREALIYYKSKGVGFCC